MADKDFVVKNGLVTGTNNVTIGNAVYIVASGNVGIQNSAPAHDLSVNGPSYFGGNIVSSINLSANTTGVYHTGTVNAASHTVGTSTVANATGVYTGIVNAASHTVGTSFTANATMTNTASLVVSTNTSTFGTAAYIVANGSVGVGTSTPNSLLTVVSTGSNLAFNGITGVYNSNQGASSSDTGGAGIAGYNFGGFGVLGRTNTGIGVIGTAWGNNSFAVAGYNLSTTINSVAGYFHNQGSGTGVRAIASNGSPFIAANSSAESFVVTGNGNIGIGTSSPSADAGWTYVTADGSANGGVYEVKKAGLSIGKIGWDAATSNGLMIDNPTNTSISLAFAGTQKAIFYGNGFVNIPSGSIKAGIGTSTDGMVILQGSYGSGSLTNFSSEYATGAPTIGYGVIPTNSSIGFFLSSTTIPVDRAAYTLGGQSHRWYTGDTQTIAVGSAVTCTEKMLLASNGNLGIGNSTPEYKLTVNGSIKGFGNAFFNYINSNTGNSENPSVSQVIVTNGTDNYYRKASIGHLAAYVRDNSSGTWAISITGNANYASSAGSAGSASSVAWTNVSGRPSYLSEFINDLGNYGNYVVSGSNASLYSLSVSLGSGFSIGSGSSSANIYMARSANSVWRIIRSVGEYIGFMNTAGTGWSAVCNGDDLSVTGNITAYASDERLKTNFTNITNAVDKVKQLGGYTFDWQIEKCKSVGFTPSNNHEHGLKAQEVQKIVADAVELAPFDVDTENGGVSKSGENYLTVKYEKMIPLLIEAIKELSDKVEKLENK